LAFFLTEEIFLSPKPYLFDTYFTYCCIVVVENYYLYTIIYQNK